MRQIEFDTAMNKLRNDQTAESMPLKNQIEALNARKMACGYQINALQAQISAIVAERDQLEQQLRAIGAKYYNLKHELIIANPKDSMEDEKARQGTTCNIDGRAEEHQGEDETIAREI